MDIDFEKLMSSLKKLKNTTDIKDFDKYLRLSVRLQTRVFLQNFN